MQVFISSYIIFHYLRGARNYHLHIRWWRNKQYIFKLNSPELLKMQNSLKQTKSKQFCSLTQIASTPDILFTMFYVTNLTSLITLQFL